MVCKRSLYCWKNGPCATDQTRKQIWEDNIKFRENLRDINQSDHYWSFQISKNKCLCLEGEDQVYNRPLSRKYRSSSLQQLHFADCSSITHDFNGLKFRNCFVHCPILDLTKHSEIKRADTPAPELLTKKENALSCIKHPFYSAPKSEDRNGYCHRYKNTSSNSRLKPSMKTKFLSQSNLSSLNENKNLLLERKVLHNSCENIQRMKVKETKPGSPIIRTEKTCQTDNQRLEAVSEKVSEKSTESEIRTTRCETQGEPLKGKMRKELKTITKLPHKGKMQELSPISRTTRKMLSENKKIPFVTYGCNNNNIDVGSKRTHNVLASKLEVYPNALSAKQQKRDLIMKYIQSEKEFQRKCLPKELQRVNHSSLWSLDNTHNKKESKGLQKSNKYLLPVVSKPIKKLSAPSSQFDFNNYRTCCKPQVYFY